MALEASCGNPFFDKRCHKTVICDFVLPIIVKARCNILCWGHCLMLFSFSFFFPSNQIFIFENNIYYCAHVGKQAIRVVSTGKEGVIFNGLSDWLYEGRTRHLGQLLVMSLNYTLELQTLLELDIQHCISGHWWTTKLKTCYSNSCLMCWTGNNVK